MKAFSMLTLVMLTGCTGLSSDTRIFATWKPAAAGFDSGIIYSAEQRIRKGPVMALAGGSYSPTRKKGAEDGYQYGFDIGARHYLDSFFVGAGYYWSGYRMEFADGRVWEKDGHNWTWAAGWERGPWEFSIAGSPKESQTQNRVSFFAVSAECRFWRAWVLSVGLKKLDYDQGDSRDSSFIPKFGLGVEF